MKTRISDSGYKQYDAGDGWEYTHRTVAEKNYGDIPAGHEVHHINGNKLDNRPENLQILSKEEHQQIHNNQFDSPDSYDSSDNDYHMHVVDRDGEDWYYFGGEAWAPVNNVE